VQNKTAKLIKNFKMETARCNPSKGPAGLDRSHTLEASLDEMEYNTPQKTKKQSQKPQHGDSFSPKSSTTLGSAFYCWWIASKHPAIVGCISSTK
jgi:hypothetical protein